MFSEMFKILEIVVVIFIPYHQSLELIFIFIKISSVSR